MNTKYATGPVIRSASAASFSAYAFPAQLPTEEWAGDEARSYANYIRPIANLFENDRAQEAFVKNLIKGTFTTTDNVVINGCGITTTGTYYEVTDGIFLNDGSVYQIYPACEAAAKQIEAIAQTLAIDADVKIWYDGIYHYSYILNSLASQEQINSSAAGTISAILTALGIQASSFKVEDSIILPIFVNASGKKFYFYGSSVQVGNSVPSGATELGIASSAKISGNKVSADGTITNAALQNSSIQIGNTAIQLGSSSASLAGVAINGVTLSTNSSGVRVTDNTYGITAKGNYTLGAACEKAVGFGDAELPTASDVKSYVSSYVNTQSFTGNIHFTNGISLDTGQLHITSASDASYNGSALSGNASISTLGGIEAAGSIYSRGSIVGLNAGTYSSREYKENITPFVESAVDLINTVDIVNYTYKADAEHNHKIGFIADDTHEYFATKSHNIMDQSNCIGLLLKAVQELSEKVEELRKKVDGINS